MRQDDLTGMRFGKLIALEPGEPQYRRNGQRNTTWRCKCDCGRERTVRTAYLKRGDVTYCGHCTPPPWLEAKYRKCRYCEYSEWDKERGDWNCSEGKDTSAVKNKCDAFYCAPRDKILNTKMRESPCYICGKPVYAHSRHVPLYCKEHRKYADLDNKIIHEAPEELMHDLTVAIFLRAREDYINNCENQRSDAEVFLRGQWAQKLSLDHYDADKLMKLLDEERHESKRP